MVECHAGLEIAPYISSAMRRETLFSTSQKPRTDVDHDEGVVGGGERARAAVSLDFLIRTKLDVHMHTRSPPPSSLYSSNGGSSLWAFSPLLVPFFFLLSTSDKPLNRLFVIHSAPTVEFYTFRSRVSFSLGRIIRLKIGRYSGGKTYRKIFFNRKKKYEKKNIQEEKRIYFSIFSLELYIPAEYYHRCRRRQVEKLHAQYYWVDAHWLLLQEQNAFYALWMDELNIFSDCIRFQDCLRHN